MPHQGMTYAPECCLTEIPYRVLGSPKLSRLQRVARQLLSRHFPEHHFCPKTCGAEMAEEKAKPRAEGKPKGKAKAKAGPPMGVGVSHPGKSFNRIHLLEMRNLMKKILEYPALRGHPERPPLESHRRP